ncbi:MAG: hypothetical protein E5W83_17840 [Mesorhizobium sp.]|nr:MAG: hypothetical protein E5W83_17840 [Mesorhizobium sp.]
MRFHFWTPLSGQNEPQPFWRLQRRDIRKHPLCLTRHHMRKTTLLLPDLFRLKNTGDRHAAYQATE